MYTIKLQRIILLFLIFHVSNACNNSVHPSVKTLVLPHPLPKNIILMIGDGMGLGQITAGLYKNGNQLELERLPYIGLQKTYSANNLITDSAAGATAFSTGYKTYNGAIAVDQDSIPLPTIVEQAEKKGLTTGIVVTSTIVHATPAAFFAHNVSRDHYEEIALDLLDANVDIFIGGGKRYFDKRRSDNRNLIQELTDKNYRCFDLINGNLPNISNYQKNIGIFTDDSDPATAMDGRTYLAPATTLALDFLKNHKENGFFLMVEGSQIDWGGHANDVSYILTEMIDFDQTIGKVMDFAEKDGETLVIVTADHETGGFSVNLGSSMDTIVGVFNTASHTADLVPVFAYGPGAELFSGIYENTDINIKIKKLMEIIKN